MKKRVRILPLFLVVVLCLSLFTGCDRKKQGPEAAAGASSAEASLSETVSSTVSVSVETAVEAADKQKEEVASSASAASSASKVDAATGEASAGAAEAAIGATGKGATEAAIGTTNAGAAEAAIEASVTSALSTAAEADASTGRSEEAAASFKSATGSGGTQSSGNSKTDKTTDSTGLFKNDKVDVQIDPPDKVAHPTDAGKVSDQSSNKANTNNKNTSIDEKGTYTSKDDVALYIHTYGKLPSNFITKKEANALGWSGGSLEKYAPGKSIGGDKFGNYEGLLPTAKGRKYYECDIDTLGKSKRGAKRIIFSSDGLIYYTSDHYESFEQLY